MSLEKKFFNCGNALNPSVCDPWVLSNMSWQSDESKQELNKQEPMANGICAKCEHFTPKENVVS